MVSGGQKMTADKFHTFAKCNSLEPVSEEKEIGITSVGETVCINGELVNIFPETGNIEGGIVLNNFHSHNNKMESTHSSENNLNGGDAVPKCDKVNNNEKSGFWFRKCSKKDGYGLAAIMRGESLEEKRKKFRSASKMSTLFDEFSLAKIRVSLFS